MTIWTAILLLLLAPALLRLGWWLTRELFALLGLLIVGPMIAAALVRQKLREWGNQRWLSQPVEEILAEWLGIPKVLAWVAVWLIGLVLAVGLGAMVGWVRQQ